MALWILPEIIITPLLFDNCFSIWFYTRQLKVIHQWWSPGHPHWVEVCFIRVFTLQRMTHCVLVHHSPLVNHQLKLRWRIKKAVLFLKLLTSKWTNPLRSMESWSTSLNQALHSMEIITPSKRRSYHRRFK